MGFITSMFTGNSGSPQETKPNAGPTEQQLEQTYQRTTDAYGEQQKFANAAADQNGLANQRNVFSQMQGLAGQLGQQAQGEGPNPALAQLNQTTGQNIASQASLAAGQRGSSQNVGMMARQIGQQGAATQQQAVGQSAVMRAQQQIAAQQALQQQQGMMGGMANQQVGQQAAAVAGMGQMANAQQQNVLGAQSDINKVNAQIALANQKAQQGLVGGILGSMGAGVSKMAHGGVVKGYADGGKISYKAPTPINVQNSAPPSHEPQSRTVRMMNGFDQAASSENPMQAGAKQFFSPIMKQIGQGVKDLFGGKAAADTAAAEGTTWGGSEPTSGTALTKGEAAADTAAAEETSSAAGAVASGEGSEAAVLLAAHGGSLALGKETDNEPDGQEDWTSVGGILGGVMSDLAHGGRIPARISPGEIVLSHDEASSPQKAAKSAKLKEKANIKVPGKAKVKGDSLKNDTVKANLEEGGIVVPRTHASDPEKAARFAYAVAMKNRKGIK